MRLKTGNILLLLLALGLLPQCKKEKFFTGSTTLQFSHWDDYSLDTLTFDTVFTLEPGTNNPISVTQKFWVKNKEKHTVRASFRLSGGSASPFRINIDGFAGPDIREIEIPGGDSVWGFVQCSLKPNNLSMPALVLDSIISTVNAVQQKMYLQAYGWDAHYYNSQELPCGGTWTDKAKPYFIVNSALVATGCTFTIKEGVTVYNSPRSALFVQGTLKIEGTATERVTFLGNKARYDVRELPNQWVGIHFLTGSAGNSIQYADIRNATVGIRCDSLPVGSPKNLVLENTAVMWCGQAAMIGITAHIDASNCIFGQVGSYSFLGLLGGNYSFRHCSFATYATDFGVTRDKGHFVLTNTLRDENGKILQTQPLNCDNFNSIIYGNLEDELYIDKGGSAAFSTNFMGNFMRSKEKPFPGADNTYNVYPKFMDENRGDFALDTLSPCINAGKTLAPPVLIDYFGKPRSLIPDVGAIER